METKQAWIRRRSRLQSRWVRPVAGIVGLVLLTGMAPPSDSQLPVGAQSSAWPASAGISETADVVVVGAGTSGIAAAIGARRNGAKRVFLLEETDYIGGQVAEGVGTMDEGSVDRYDQRQEGWWRVLVARFLREYKERGWPHTSTCYGAATAGKSVCVSPSVGRTVYTQMLREAGVVVRLGVDVRPRIADGRVLGVSWVKNVGVPVAGDITAPVLIDASELGDMLAASGAPYRAGNGLVNVPGSSAKGYIADITWTAVVKKYSAGTMPSVLNLKGKPFPVPVGDPNPSATKSRVLAAFAAKVAVGGSPYNNTTHDPWSPVWHLQYRGLPDPNKAPYLAKQTSLISRTVINYANDYPSEVAGDGDRIGLSARYLTDSTYRNVINCRAKLRTIEFVWYMQNVLGQAQWSVATDEGFDTPYSRATRCAGTIVAKGLDAFEANMPVRPYVRESRRGLGLSTLTTKDIRRLPTGEPGSGPFGETSVRAHRAQPSDSIAVGYYIEAVHGPVTDDTLETDLETGADLSGGGGYGPFPIPLGSLIDNDVSGLLLAEKNISQTRLVAGGTRLQPETTSIGAAAGALAGLAVGLNQPPSAIRVEWVQHRLSRDGQYLAVNRFLDIARNDDATAALEISALYGLDPNETHTLAKPDAYVTRSQAATWIRRSTRLPDAATQPGYTDVDPAAAWAGDVAALAATGAPLPCGSGAFCPGSTVTRGQYITWLGYAMDATLGTSWRTAAEPTTGRFTDVKVGTSSPIIHALSRHLASHYQVVFPTTKFYPDSPIRRRYAATWSAWQRIDPAFNTDAIPTTTIPVTPLAAPPEPASPSPSSSPTPAESPSPSMSPSPSTSDSPSPSPSPSMSEIPATSPSPSMSETASMSPSPSTSDNPSPTPSMSVTPSTPPAPP